MELRQEIIKRLDKPVEKYELYYKLKMCLEYNKHIDTFGRNNDSMIDDWFKGVIDSLYYRPNKYCLVLVGGPGIGKSQFFRELLKRDINSLSPFYGDIGDYIPDEFIYENLIIQYQEVMNKNQLKLPEKENFVTMMGQFESGKIRPVANKRLASYCCTTNVWRHKPRKNFIVLNLESINQELFNSIDKELLWIEIFNKFKPEGK